MFVVFFHGEQIKLRVKKVCHGFKATLYPCPATYKDQLDMLAGVGTRIKDLEMVIIIEFEAVKTEMNDMDKKGMWDGASFAIMKSL